MGLLYCAIYAAAAGALFFFLGRLFPKRALKRDSFPFRPFKWERDGAVYEALRMKKWQRAVPDMSRIFPRMMPAKKLEKMPGAEGLLYMIEETCVAEAVHGALCVVGLAMLAIWPGAGGIACYAVYALLGNLPFLLIQRYNRPRLSKMLDRRVRRALREREADPPRGVLLLSCNNGGGHNACADALAERFRAEGVPCERVDTMRETSPVVSWAMSTGHVLMYRFAPRLFRVVYSSPERHPQRYRDGYAVNWLISSGCEHLYMKLLDSRCGMAVSTHVFASFMLSRVVERRPIRLRTANVATDYTCSPFTKESRLDRCFIPDGSLEDEFVCENIPRDSIFASGIPLREPFTRDPDRAQARLAQGIPRGSAHILVMCGSMGSRGISGIVRGAAREMKETDVLTVVCGTNKNLLRRLRRRYRKDARVRVTGYAQDVCGLMDSADVFVTKPGGLSVTEAVSRRLPMVLADVVAGCEEHNARFMEKMGIAVSRPPRDAGRAAVSIAHDPEALSRMRACAAVKEDPALAVFREMTSPQDPARACERVS